jgi:outer membrane protein TolC
MAFVILQAGTFAMADTLKLAECYGLAIQNYPLSENIQLYGRIGELKRSNIESRYYPQISLFGQAQYQSDVTKIDIDLTLPGGLKPAFPEMVKDQYKIGINLNQLIWDGGAAASEKSLEETKSLLDEKNTLVELYSLKEKVNSSFFNIMIIREREKSLETAKNDLENNIKIISSLVENGVLLESNLDILKAALITISRKKTNYKG